jgi:two-component system, OmpR family, phosphate regulon response regulator PhoB
MAAPFGLVVDDDAQLRLLFAQVLRLGGLRVLEAGSGREALRLARPFAPDFVVTDIEMPDVDGLELCRRLRERPATSKVPIVVVTGFAMTQADEAIAAGCDVVLAKPCSGALLLATIQRLLVQSPGSTRKE